MWMTKKADIEGYLNNCATVVGSGCAIGTGLIAVHKRIFNQEKNVSNAVMVRDLLRFYSDEKNILDIWAALGECERDFITYIVQYCGREYLPTTLAYAKKHKIPLEFETGFGYKRNIMDYYGYLHLKFLHLLTKHVPGTKTPLLFPSGKDMPPFVLAVLQTVVEPMECEYGEYVPTKGDYVICRENRLGDFAAVARFAGSEQLKVKPGTYDVTKAKLAKLSEVIGFEEVCDKDGVFCVPKDVKRNSDFKVAPLLLVLAINSGLVEIDSEGNVLPGKKSTDLLMLPLHEFAKKLFDDYACENGIYEPQYITYVKTYGGERWVKWHACRKLIFELLKTCPEEVFVKFEDFEKYVKIFYGDAFRRLLNYAIMVNGYNFSYDHLGSYASSWDKYEAKIVMLILSFLSTIGMVDIAYAQSVSHKTYVDKNACVRIAGFRITKLGAWILGMVDKYEATSALIAQNDEGELLVLPDYSIVLSGLKCRIKHEVYFSRFLTKVSSDENVSVYKLDFKSIVRAFDNGITPMKIQGYLKNACSKALPDNVNRTLVDWQSKVGRVKIRELLVLETDDVLLLEEIKHIRAMGDMIVGDLQHAVILVDDSKKKAKTLIEKNGWLVKI